MAIGKDTMTDLARIGMALSYADGDIDEREVAMLLLALQDLGASTEAAEEAIDAAGQEVEGAANVDDLLARSCAAIPAKARPTAFEACAHIVMGDGELGPAEVQRLAAVKGLLGVDDALAITIVASAAVAAAQENDGLEVTQG